MCGFTRNLPDAAAALMVKLLNFSLSVMVHQLSCEANKEKQDASAVEGASVSQELTSNLAAGHILFPHCT